MTIIIFSTNGNFRRVTFTEEEGKAFLFQLKNMDSDRGWLHFTNLHFLVANIAYVEVEPEEVEKK